MTFSNDDIKKRRIYRLAQIIYDHWEEKSGMDTRYFDHPFIHDVYTINGQSKNGGNYREHVVPRVYLRDSCFRLFDNGVTIEEVVEVLLTNLLVVNITTDEAEKLNQKLKNTMPEGWILGENDPLERLYSVGIELK